MSKGHTFALLSFVFSVGLAIGAYYLHPGPWFVALAILICGVLFTLIPLLQAFLNQVKLDEAPVWFKDAGCLGPETKRVQDHYERLKGTLVYWKNSAAAHHRLHTARVFWSLLAAVLLPVLVRLYDGSAVWAKVFMTTFTTWTGLVVALAYTFKSEQRYQGMRQQESDYYDLARRLLDFTDPADPKLKEIVDQYFRDVEDIRQTARRVETGAPPSALDLAGRRG